MARNESLIISEEVFRSMTPVSGDLDWEYVWPIVLSAQDRWIQPTLGQSLYQKIMTDIINGALVDPYKLLVDDYISRTLVWFTCYDGLSFWAVKVVNSGVVLRVVDDGQPITLNDVDKLREMCRERAEFYKQRLIDYLCANAAKDFPEYMDCMIGEVHAERVNYSGGLNLESYIGDAERRRRERRLWH